MLYLSIDPGAKRLGLARGDDVTGVSVPVAVVAHTGVETAVVTIIEHARKHGINEVVIGLPTNSEGEETPACARSHALAQQLEAAGLRTILQPEFLSSHEARRRARAAGRPRSAPVDDLAAQIILEDFFSSR
jgi:putative Holliday junction resolvase